MMADKKEKSTPKKSKKKSVPGFTVKATDPLAERMAAVCISMLENAGETGKAKEMRKAHGKIRDFQAE